MGRIFINYRRQDSEGYVGLLLVGNLFCMGCPFTLPRTPSLPGLILHVPTLWQETLPGPAATAAAVKSMLESSK